MSFRIMTDTSANLPTDDAVRYEIGVIPLSYSHSGQEHVCLDTREFDCSSYYARLKGGLKVTTSQINPQRYMEAMENVLRGGEDILFVGMSSGISGSFGSAKIAAGQLADSYPRQKIRLVDSLGASLGEGLLVYSAIDCREQGMSLDETADFLLKRRDRIYQYFTVDDLMFLHRGGRLSNASAIVGTLLNVKPLLKGNEIGKIVTCGKVRGRKRVIENLAEKFNRTAVAPEAQTIGISHCDCLEDVRYLTSLLNASHPPKKIIVVEHEPVTGSYLGPGALALYFEGDENIRLH